MWVVQSPWPTVPGGPASPTNVCPLLVCRPISGSLQCPSVLLKSFLPSTSPSTPDSTSLLADASSSWALAWMSLSRGAFHRPSNGKCGPSGLYSQKNLYFSSKYSSEFKEVITWVMKKWFPSPPRPPNLVAKARSIRTWQSAWQVIEMQ